MNINERKLIKIHKTTIKTYIRETCSSVKKYACLDVVAIAGVYAGCVYRV